jgi:hypothetical protein
MTSDTVNAMVRNCPPLWICAATVFLWSCKDKPIEAANPAPKPVIAVDYAAGLPVAGNLAEQLQVESASRPKDALTAEAVLEALVKAEIPVGNTKQGIGRTVLANYCFGGSTARNTQVVICEYGSPEAAIAGREHSLKHFAAITNRTLTLNKRTVLTLVGAGESPETKAEMQKAAEVFSKL